VTFETASKLSERHELGVVDRTGRAQHRVVEGRRMPLAEDEVVVRGIVRLLASRTAMRSAAESDEVG
jgi:hypothetical protein